jgi:hypothetical protein
MPNESSQTRSVTEDKLLGLSSDQIKRLDSLIHDVAEILGSQGFQPRAGAQVNFIRIHYGSDLPLSNVFSIDWRRKDD